MRFLLRSLLVLTIAAAIGIVLYYAVQALPGSSPNQPGARLEPPSRGNAPQNLPPRPERPENGGGGGFPIRSIFNVAVRAVQFSILVTISVLSKNLIFKRKSKGKNSSD